MSDRIAVMAEGGIAQLGTPAELYLQPRTAFVAGFLGETNMLSATFCGTEDGLAVVRLRGEAVGRARLPAGAVPNAGSTVAVSLRPECVRLSLTDGPVAGVLETCTFLGRHTRAIVRTADGPWVVSVADWSPGTALRPGTPVRLSWAGGDAQVLAASE